MIRNLKKIFLTAAAALSTVYLFGEPAAAELNLKNCINPSYYDELMQKKDMKIVHEKMGEGFELALVNDYRDNLFANKIFNKKNNYPYLYERVIILNKDDVLKSSNSSKNTITISDVSRVLRALSTMKDIKYYSKTYKRERVLYEKVSLIKSATDKTPVPDNTEENADGMVLYCLQDDASFGDCIYRLNYLENENSVYVTFTNETSIGIGFIKAINPENLRINVMVTDCGDSLLLYLATDANCTNVPGLKGKINDSLNSRMDAVYNWFIKQF